MAPEATQEQALTIEQYRHLIDQTEQLILADAVRPERLRWRRRWRLMRRRLQAPAEATVDGDRPAAHPRRRAA